MDKRLIAAVLTVFAGTSCWILSVYSADSAVNRANAEPIVVEMEEISVFDAAVANFAGLRMGKDAKTTDERPSGIREWPALESDNPVYGSLTINADANKNAVEYSFVIDESKGTGTGYDTLYFDLNSDEDISNDKPLTRLQNPPLAPYGGFQQDLWFKFFAVEIGAGAYKRNIEIAPRLVIYDGDNKRMSFVATKCRRGSFSVSKNGYLACLGSYYGIASRYDRPETGLYITPVKNPQIPASWWGGNLLTATHKFDGRLYQFSATPEGDRLTVTPYGGELGVFKIGAGARRIDGRVAMQGSVRSENTAVAVGEVESVWPNDVDECLLPTGDYLPDYMNVQFGQLRLVISDNYHSEGKGLDRENRPYIYGIQIRKDKPYVLDFLNEPKVIFTTVTQGMKVRAGDELKVKAVLIDPKLDIMFRHINDGRQRGDRPGSGKSLDPNVVISRGDGEVVAKGVMPFG